MPNVQPPRGPHAAQDSALFPLISRCHHALQSQTARTLRPKGLSYSSAKPHGGRMLWLIQPNLPSTGQLHLRNRTPSCFLNLCALHRDANNAEDRPQRKATNAGLKPRAPKKQSAEQTENRQECLFYSNPAISSPPRFV